MTGFWNLRCGMLSNQDYWALVKTEVGHAKAGGMLGFTDAGDES